eukprot:329439-Chlamydomonas_euryale.AAC.2
MRRAGALNLRHAPSWHPKLRACLMPWAETSFSNAATSGAGATSSERLAGVQHTLDALACATGQCYMGALHVRALQVSAAGESAAGERCWGERSACGRSLVTPALQVSAAGENAAHAAVPWSLQRWQARGNGAQHTCARAQHMWPR